MKEKTYYQIKINEKSLCSVKIINGVKISKKWQIKSGDPTAFKEFRDIEIQELKKDGEKFIPISAEKSDIKESSVNEEVASDKELSSTESLSSSIEKNKFEQWSDDQLKEFLIDKGADKRSVKTLTHAELIEQVAKLRL